VRSSASAALADTAVAAAANSAAVSFFMARSFSYIIYPIPQDRGGNRRVLQCPLTCHYGGPL
jgi:hypothetical protein